MEAIHGQAAFPAGAPPTTRSSRAAWPVPAAWPAAAGIRICTEEAAALAGMTGPATIARAAAERVRRERVKVERIGRVSWSVAGSHRILLASGAPSQAPWVG